MLKLPICYNIEDIDDDKAMMALNIIQSQWRLQDYVKHHADNGIEFYKEVQIIEETYHLGITNSIIITAGVQPLNAHLKQGKNIIVSKNRHYTANCILKCRNSICFYRTKAFVLAISNLISKTDEKSVNKIIDNILSIRQQVSVLEYTIIFENMLNRNRRIENKIHL